MRTSELFPLLPLEEWKETHKTLHRYTQIVGKIRMTLTPPQNHWWHVPLYVNTRGIGTGPIPWHDGRLEINFDFVEHRLKVHTSLGQSDYFELYDGLAVANFYHNLFSVLENFGIKANILAKPYSLPEAIPFKEDYEHVQYDRIYVERFWQILMQVEHVFKLFNRDFCGKVCPIQLYWHSFDLAVTRFSGKEGPPMPETDPVNKEAYSHEVISFGFWAGDENIPDAAFYSYTYPAPDGLAESSLKPQHAYWTVLRGSPMAILMYDEVRKTEKPAMVLLDFLESAYQAGIKKAGWNTQALHRHDALSSIN
jgi:hypothetical protein